MTRAHRGILAAILAYSVWGLFPVYWKLLATIAPLELFYLRIILTAIACLMLLPLRGTWPAFRAAWRDPHALRWSLFAAILLCGNSYSFIWAVNTGRVLESSLGYFLCPLVSVVLGHFVEKERLSSQRWLAVGLAAAGVLMMILIAGRIPVAALTISVCWGGYGLLKKRSGLGPVVGLGMETCLLSPFTVGVLLWMAARGPMTVTEVEPNVFFILLAAGFLTAIPLLIFSYAAKRVPLSTMGMGQYIVPTGHFGLALLYGESVDTAVFGGFALIWLGLILYSLKGGSPLPVKSH